MLDPSWEHAWRPTQIFHCSVRVCESTMTTALGLQIHFSEQINLQIRNLQRMGINCARLHLNFRLSPRCAQTSIPNPQPLGCDVEFSLALTTPPARENKPTVALVTDKYYVGQEWSPAHPTGLAKYANPQ